MTKHVMTAMAALAMGMVMASGTAQAATAKRTSFGTLADGQAVGAVELSNGHGVTARVIAYGASLQSLVIPDRSGKPADIVVGYDDMASFLKKPQFFGATVGRFANRIAKGRFTLNGHQYQTPLSDGPNSLHGGTKGFDKVLWEVVDVKNGAAASVTLRYVSPNGDQGYPGTLTTYATYSLDEQNQLTIEYRATTDAPTIVNLSNHTYWNLTGAGTPSGVMGHLVTIPAERYTPTDATAIPTGGLKPVAGTVFDFRTPHAIGERVRDASDEQIVFGRGYDHNWVIGSKVTTDTHLMAKVSDPLSGRSYELWSNQPGLQFYSGNFLDATFKSKGGKLYREGDALVMEPQVFPDAPNQPSFPSARLDPGQTYRNVIVYKFGIGANP